MEPRTYEIVGSFDFSFARYLNAIPCCRSQLGFQAVTRSPARSAANSTHRSSMRTKFRTRRSRSRGRLRPAGGNTWAAGGYGLYLGSLHQHYLTWFSVYLSSLLKIPHSWPVWWSLMRTFGWLRWPVKHGDDLAFNRLQSIGPSVIISPGRDKTHATYFEKQEPVHCTPSELSIPAMSSPPRQSIQHQSAAGCVGFPHFKWLRGSSGVPEGLQKPKHRKLKLQADDENILKKLGQEWVIGTNNSSPRNPVLTHARIIPSKAKLRHESIWRITK